MLARVPERVLLPVKQLRDSHWKWFTQSEIADDLDVTTRTLRYWLKAMADQGQGPSPHQVGIKYFNAYRRAKQWRGDYWVLVIRRFRTMK